MNKNMNKCPNCGSTSEEVKCATCNVDMTRVEEVVTEPTEATVATEEVTTDASKENVSSSEGTEASA